MTDNALAHDAQEGMTAFLEKRDPVWHGEQRTAARGDRHPPSA